MNIFGQKVAQQQLFYFDSSTCLVGVISTSLGVSTVSTAGAYFSSSMSFSVKFSDAQPSITLHALLNSSM